MARTGNYSSGFVGERKTKCSHCKKRKDCMQKKISRQWMWMCLDCLEDLDDNTSGNQTPYANNNSPNEGKPVRGMGSPPQAKVNKVERDFWGRPIRR